MSLLVLLSGDGAAAAAADDELPAWYAYSSVWQLPWLTDNATVDGLDLQEELWNVRVPTIDAAPGAFNAYWVRYSRQIIGAN